MMHKITKSVLVRHFRRIIRVRLLIEVNVNMELIWKVNADDIERVQEFYERYQNCPLVRQRIQRNIDQPVELPSKENFWDVMIGCLLTTQQRSGPKSAVARFTSIKPFPLNHSACSLQADLKAHIENTITNFGGIRRAKTIGEEISINLHWLENGGWEKMLAMLEILRENRTKPKERQVSEFVDSNLKGFGPKQARNLLQQLGFTKYEIPIDSRITKWLNSFGFPVKLSATALSDRNYYNMVSDGFQRLCEEAGIYPCLLDAAIFSSFDEDEWPLGEA